MALFKLLTKFMIFKACVTVRHQKEEETHLRGDKQANPNGLYGFPVPSPDGTSRGQEGTLIGPEKANSKGRIS